MRTPRIFAGTGTDQPLGAAGVPLSVGLGSAFPPPSLTRALLGLQDGAQALDVARHHSECDVALEPRDAMVGTKIQPVHLQGVDGGLDRAVAPAPGG
jgi:hypothetical protein